MDPLTRLLIRLAQWHRNPPSRRTIAIIGAAVAVSVSIVLVERFIGWPDWMTAERVPVRRM